MTTLILLLIVNGLLLVPALATPGPLPWLAVETLIVWLLMTGMPRWRRPLATGLGTIYAAVLALVAADALIRQSLGRGLNVYLETSAVGDTWHLLHTNLGMPVAVLLVIALLAILVLAAALFRALILRLSRYPILPRRPFWQGRGPILAGALALATFTGWAGLPSSGFLAHQASLAVHTHAAAQAFRAQLAEEPASSLQPTALERVAEVDVILAFIESYGISGLTDDRYRPVLKPRLDTLGEQLERAGLTVATGRLRSPVQGGQSWLGHLSVLSGHWINSQVAYETFLASDYPTLIDDFRATGHQTLAVMPAITEPWPEGQLFGYDRIYDHNDLGYQGPSFNWVTMPDQYTWHRFERLRQSTDAPIFAELALISSHAPWVPILPVLDDWKELNNGQVFQQWKGAGEAPVSLWQDPERVREHYIRAIDYALAVAGGYAERYLAGEDHTLLFILGDHQPAPLITGEDASRDVIVHVISADPALVAPFLSGQLPGFQAGTLPELDRDGVPMSRFRGFLQRHYGADEGTLKGGFDVGQNPATEPRSDS
ncbi:MAG TPA: sulfatase [Marinobacter sp.]|nr:sulfatase [Marinobacter sp.]